MPYCLLNEALGSQKAAIATAVSLSSTCLHTDCNRPSRRFRLSGLAPIRASGETSCICGQANISGFRVTAVSAFVGMVLRETKLTSSPDTIELQFHESLPGIRSGRRKRTRSPGLPLQWHLVSRGIAPLSQHAGARFGRALLG